MGLTKSQAAAVEHPDHLILFAGPGSGKTSTSVTKAVSILKNPKNSLCMISFTRNAADEMRHRMSAKAAESGLGDIKNRLMIGTFHSLAKAHFEKHNPTRTRLISDAGRWRLLNTITTMAERSDMKLFELGLSRAQSKIDMEGVDYTDLGPQRVNPIESDADFNLRMQGFVRDYCAGLTAAGEIDLGLMMREAVLRMSRGEWPLLPVSHMIGDEMQDADEIQLEMCLAHCKAGIVTTLVADDDQTIYGWRAAMGYGGLIHFAKTAGAKTIALQENFRSRAEVVESAKALIAYNNPDRIDKKQIATRGPGGSVRRVVLGASDAQNNWVTSYIQQEVQEGQTLAVLCRIGAPLTRLSMELMGAEIEHRLEAASIWETAEGKLFLSYLRVVVTAQTNHLADVLPSIQLDTKVARELLSHLGKTCLGFLKGKTPDLNTATATDLEHIEALQSQTRRWLGLMRTGAPSLVLEEVATYTKARIAEMNSMSAEDVEQALAGADQKKMAAALRSAYRNIDTIHRALGKMKGVLSERLSTVDYLQKKGKDSSIPVRLMTIHASKGLEFDHVIAIECQVADDTNIDSGTWPDERRLYYVAITRAKEHFIALYSGEPLPFLVEANLPESIG